MIRRSLLVIALATAFAVPVPVLAADFTFDRDHTQAEFVVTHLAISRVRGQIPLASGTLTLGPNDIPTAISATLSAKDIDSKSADRDDDLRGSDWLDVAKYPTMTFASSHIEGSSKAFTVVGDLTLHGVTKPVTLAAQTIGKLTDRRGYTHIGYSATTTIDRRQWGLNWGATAPGGALVAGFDVTVNLNIEAVSR